MDNFYIGIADNWNSFHIEEYRGTFSRFPWIHLVEAPLENLLASQEVTALLFAPQPGTFYFPVKKALESGKHVFCDKCTSLTPEQIEELFAAADTSGVRLAFEFPFLHRPIFHAAVHCLKSTAIGKLHSVFIRNAHNGLTARTLPPQFLSNPHGILYDIGFHPLYVALALFGMPDQIFSQAQKTSTGAIHTCHSLLSVKNCRLTYFAEKLPSVAADCTIVCESSYCSAESGFSFALYGSRGCMRADAQAGHLHFISNPLRIDSDHMPLMQDSLSQPDAASDSVIHPGLSGTKTDLELWLDAVCGLSGDACARGIQTVGSTVRFVKQAAALAEGVYRTVQ